MEENSLQGQKTERYLTVMETPLSMIKKVRQNSIPGAEDLMQFNFEDLLLEIQ